MAEIDAVRTLLSDAFERISGQVDAVTDGLDEQESAFRPDAEANSVGWLLWHLTRVQDDHVAELAGVPQSWTADGWAQRFGLPFDESATGYGQSSEEVGAVRVPGALLAGYHRSVRELTTGYLDSLTLDELERVVDENWDPPVTASSRLVSVINDCTDHLGQAEYVLGLARRR